MATYSAVASTEKDAKSPINVNLIDKLDQNPHAIAEGASGAPKIQTAALEQTGGSEAVTQACIRDSAVGQAELKTSEETDSTSNNEEILILSSGQYTLGLSLARTGGSSYANYTGNVGIAFNSSGGTDSVPSTSHTSYLSIGDGNYLSGGVETKVRYVTASPPYDLGDGEIPLFTWVKVDSNGNPISIQTSITPPWAYNGPTDIRPKRYVEKDGLIIGMKDIIYIDELTGEAIKKSIEIDTAYKNSDMDLIPHPFVNLKTGEKVVLLDPPETLYLSELREAGESVNELLHNDYLRVDNETITRKVPNGVMPCKFKWKNSRSRAGEMIKDRREKRGPFANKERRGNQDPS